ncbi:oxygenase MpaB family protein [Naasia sp. SYSU D00948]|uniref:oxygenase MpaB family protein n=1 Tax=Naasia sp. SYSU D00948 TaxID=2817379 RepID=UPI001B312673|nr:oxygenase MpaB family protein [Naasia sp. SYSU D00948]
MSRVLEPLRAKIQTTLSGHPAGDPPWVTALEFGTDPGYFGPGSAAWAVHGDVPTLVAGIRALLTQALHPGAMAGVHDHSRYREDPFGRLAGTIRWIFTVTYGSREDAARASAWVLRLHEKVRGVYPGGNGTAVPYSANDPELLRWVHLAFTDAFLGAHRVWGKPIPGGEDAYVRDWAIAGELMGVDGPPVTAAELHDQLRSYLGVLRHDDRVEDVVRFLRRPPLAPALRSSYPLLFNAAVASLPDDLRELLGLAKPNRAVIPATGVVLRATGRLLGLPPGAEKAAIRRIERLGGATASPAA